MDRAAAGEHAELLTSDSPLAQLSPKPILDGEMPEADGCQAIPRVPDPSRYVAAWDSASDDTLGQYLSDIRHYDLLSPDAEQELYKRIAKLRGRASQVLLRAPTTLPALIRLQRWTESSDRDLHRMIRPVPFEETEPAQSVSRLRQSITHLQQLGCQIDAQRSPRRATGREARQRYVGLWTCWLRTCETLRFQPDGYEMLRQALAWGEGVHPDNPLLCTARHSWNCATRSLGRIETSLLHANLRLVIYVATRYKDRGVPLSDLIQEGNLGLMRAIEKFDPDRGVKFATYAHWWVRQAISRALVNQSRTVRLPSYVIDRQSKLRAATARLWEVLHRSPSGEELSTALGWTLPDVQALQSAARPLLRLNEPVTEDGYELEDAIEDHHTTLPGARLDAEKLQHCLTQCFNLLPPRQTFILRLRYGFETGNPHSLQEIATLMGLSRERVRQLEKAAFATLRRSQYGLVLADFVDAS